MPISPPIWEGECIAVGEYCLEVIHVPGHTPGSIALLDRKHKFLLSGDTVQDRTIYMHGEARNLKAFCASISKLIALRDGGAFDTVYTSQGSVKLSASVLHTHLALAEGV